MTVDDRDKYGLKIFANNEQDENRERKGKNVIEAKTFGGAEARERRWIDVFAIGKNGCHWMGWAREATGRPPIRLHTSDLFRCVVRVSVLTIVVFCSAIILLPIFKSL